MYFYLCSTQTKTKTKKKEKQGVKTRLTNLTGIKINVIKIKTLIKIISIIIRKINKMILKVIIYLKTNSSNFFKHETIKQKLKEVALFILSLF